MRCALALICAGTMCLAQTPASVEGRVVNALTGEPVRKVNLILRPAGDENPVHSASSDAEGHFRITALGAGNYQLFAQKTGFLPQSYGGTVRNPWRSSRITVSDGQQIKDLELKLSPHSVITGKVLDEDGDPVQGVQVSLSRLGYNRGKRQMLPSAGGVSNDLGEFRVTGVSPGRYLLCAENAGPNILPRSGPGAKRGGGNEDYVATFYPGSVEPSEAAAIEVASGQQMSGMDIRLRKSAVYRVTGKVMGGSANTHVMLVPKGGDFPISHHGDMVKADKTFSIPGVPPGDYLAVATSFDGRLRAMARASVTVGNQDVDGISLAISTGVEIPGVVRVIGADGTQKPVGSGIRVNLSPVDSTGFSPNGDLVKEDGSVTFPSVSSDRYRVDVHYPLKRLYLKWVTLGGQDVLETGIDWSQGPSGTVEITLSAAGGEVSGVAQNEKGEPAKDAMVVLVPEPAKPQLQFLYRTETAGQNGQFSFKALAPGTYRVLAPGDIEEGEQFDPDFIKNYGDKSVKVKVEENSRQQIQVIAGPL